MCMEVMGIGTVALGSEGVFPSQTKETEICGSYLGGAWRCWELAQLRWGLRVFSQVKPRRQKCAGAPWEVHTVVYRAAEARGIGIGELGTGGRALPKPRAAAVPWGFAKANTGVLGLVGPTWDWESESDFWFGLLGFNSEKL